MGGPSNEAEISRRSGKNIFKALQNLGYKNAELIEVDENIAATLRTKNIEFVYNAMHGRFGEDGCIQGMLEVMGIPYTGCGVMASSVCMNKEYTKNILKEAGIPLIKAVLIKKGEDYKEKIKELTAAKSRCMPFVQENIDDKCVVCGKKAYKMVVWGRQY